MQAPILVSLLISGRVSKSRFLNLFNVSKFIVSELKSEIYQDLIRDYHKAKDDKDDELRRKIGHILNNTYLKKINFN